MSLIILSKIKLKGFCVGPHNNRFRCACECHCVCACVCFFKWSLKRFEVKRTKKHVILISQTAHANPWICTDPQLIMTPAARLQPEVWRSEQAIAHSSHGGGQSPARWPRKKKKITRSSNRCKSELIVASALLVFRLHKLYFFSPKWNAASPKRPKHFGLTTLVKPHRTQRAYQFISHLMAYFKL